VISVQRSCGQGSIREIEKEVNYALEMAEIAAQQFTRDGYTKAFFPSELYDNSDWRKKMRSRYKAIAKVPTTSAIQITVECSPAGYGACEPEVSAGIHCDPSNPEKCSLHICDDFWYKDSTTK
jgi:hypothetical protein